MRSLPHGPARHRGRIAAKENARDTRPPGRGRRGEDRQCRETLQAGRPRGHRVAASHLRPVRILPRGKENLCDNAEFTGYTVDGGYAEYALAAEQFTYPIPEGFPDDQAAPLLCAGIIGF